MSSVENAIEAALKVTKIYADKALDLQRFLTACAKTDDYAGFIDWVQRYLREAEALQNSLRQVLTKAMELASIQVQHEKYSEQWWYKHREVLYEDFQDDPQRGLSRWLQIFAESLIDWNLATCKKMANEPFPFPPQAVDIPTLCQNGIKAIKENNYQQALDMLWYLTQARAEGQSQYILNDIDRATLLVFIGRIFLYNVSQSEEALKYFERAQLLSPLDGRPHTALGNYNRLKKDYDKALTFYHQAIELSPKQPDGYIGMGLLFEDQAHWDEADDQYDEAINAVQDEKDIDIALSRLLAPTSGNLYLQLARALKKKDPERALQAVERAVALGIKHDGDYPERLGYRLKGEILEKLGKLDVAADAYYEAAKRFRWRNEYKIAAEILWHVSEINPANIAIYWDLADEMRQCSYLTDPPYADKDMIEKSLSIWQKGFERRPADTDYALAYVVRALINEPRARMPDADRWTLWWQAVAYLERAMVLNETTSKWWTFLGLYYRSLKAGASAMQATSKAIEYDPTDLNALYERAAELASMGDNDAALEVIEKRLKQGSNVWVEHVKAIVLIHKESYEQARDILQDILKASPEEVLYRSHIALCYVMLNETGKAQEQYEWIWKRYQELGEESSARNRNSYGWAAYMLDMIDEAIDIYKELLKDPISIGNTYWNLGICYLTQGNLSLGEEYLNKGVELTENVQELDDLLKLDIYNFEKSSENWPHKDDAHKVFEEIKVKIKARRALIKKPRSLEEELKDIIEKYPAEEGKINWTWIGAHAGLARFYLEEKRWSDAVSMYLLLQEEGERFLEAHKGLEKVFDRLQAEGDVLVKEGKPREALERFKQLLLPELLPDDKTRQAQLYSRLGYVYFDLADSENARKNFTKALQFYHENNTSSPGGALGEICRSLFRDATHYWALDDGWKGMANEVGSDEMLRSDLAFARRAVENFLDEFYKLSEQYVDRNALLPVATPIVLEIGEGLVNRRQEWQEWPLFKSYIPEMRQWFQDEMGVVVPRIRVRENDVLSSNGYTIMLDEAEIERGRVYLDMRYCPVPSQTLEALGVPKVALIEQPQPMTGEPGCWIPHDSWDLAINNNLELWAEPLVYIIYHLETVLLKNLSNFLGVQEVESLLAEWEKRDGASPLVASALSDQRARYHFAQVLRALVSEQVPITSWKDILEAFQESGPLDADVNQAVRVIRLRLKRQLPGNNPNAQRLDLPLGWEDILIAGLGHKNGRVTFTGPPEEIYKFLLVIRNAVGFREWDLVLVTRSSELRPFIRRLVEHEFPHLMVLSQEELLTQEELMEVDQEAVVEQAKGVVADEQ